LPIPLLPCLLSLTQKPTPESPQGVGQWKALENAGDVKRFLRWCILSVREQSLDPKTAATLGQIACYLLNAIETADFEGELTAIKKRLDAQDEIRTQNGTVTH
jgi:hypothetical protein